MDNKIDIDQLLGLQYAYDNKNSYMPSFFRIKMGVSFDLANIPDIPFGAFAAFFHEYIHFLQDVTTMYGLMNIETTSYYVRDVASHIVKQEKKEFTVPQKITKKEDYGYKNNLLKELYMGSSINPQHKKVVIKKYEIRNIKKEDFSLDIVNVTCTDSDSNKDFVIQFGGNILTEGMAFQCEYQCNSKKFEENGLQYPNANDMPYAINMALAQHIYKEFVETEGFLVTGIADISLMTYNCGLTFVKFIEHLKDIDFLEKIKGKQLDEKVKDLYQEGYSFINFKIEDFKKVQDYVYNEAKEYFHMPIADELNKWLKRLFEKSYELRTKFPFYIMDIVLESASVNDIRTNSVFSNIFLGMGTPLIINAEDEGQFLHPEGFQESDNFMPGFYWAIDEIRRIFMGIKESKTCPLKEYCIASSIKKPNSTEYCQSDIVLKPILVDDNCNKSPWLRAKKTDGLCVVGAIWKHWGLSDYVPIY